MAGERVGRHEPSVRPGLRRAVQAGPQAGVQGGLRALGQQDERQPTSVEACPPRRRADRGPGVLEHLVLVADGPHDRRVEPGERGPAPLAVAVRVLGQRGQVGIGLVDAALQRRRPGRQQGGVEPGARVGGGAGEGFGPDEVGAFAGDGGAAEQRLRVGLAGGEAPGGEAQDVVVGRAAALDRSGQRLDDGDGPHRRGGRADDVADERMGEADPEPVAVDVGRQHAAAFEGLGHAEIGQGVDLVAPQRLAVGDELDEGPLLVVQVREVGGHELTQPGRRGGLAVEAPDPAVVPQRTVLDGARHELAQEQHAALHAVEQLCGGRRIDGAAEHRDEQLAGLVDPEGRELDALAQPVLPQRDDGVGRRGTGADRGEHPGGIGGHDLMDQRGRRRVEQVGVVDEHQDGRVVRAGGERGDRALQRRGTAGGRGRAVSEAIGRVGEQRGDGAEGHRGRGPRGRELHRVEARLGRESHARPAQGGAARSGRCGQHHAVTRRPRQQVVQDRQLGRSARQRPRRDRCRVRHPGTGGRGTAVVLWIRGLHCDPMTILREGDGSLPESSHHS